MKVENAVDIADAAFKVTDADRLKNFVVEFISKNLESVMKGPNWQKISNNPEILNAILIKKI